MKLTSEAYAKGLKAATENVGLCLLLLKAHADPHDPDVIEEVKRLERIGADLADATIPF
ncbi:MAG: hypothetical protein Q8R28_15155 [Dehalococcoidia bacterium]|nr:hypothetical protein [Dehalococcoidia bacterium]